jgi:Sec-independent protein translocase protein TatA
MGGFHFLDLLVILGIILLVAGPKALQSMSRNAGRGLGKAKAMKDEVLAGLPMEELSEMSEQIPRVPLNPQQAAKKLLLPGQEKKKEKPIPEEKEAEP